ncbi:hypothetical protein WMF18_01710 [Sorangium sp. So ce315]|uniref:hypothetical protein n=1 Tax=Sorangium sp. So ce315 TaxID=3133299 RepID=UPI003F600DD4
MESNAPVYRLRLDGSLTEVRASLWVVNESGEELVRALGGDGAHVGAIGILTSLGLKADDAGSAFVAYEAAALRFWVEGLASTPEAWELFVPEDLAAMPGADVLPELDALLEDGDYSAALVLVRERMSGRSAPGSN